MAEDRYEESIGELRERLLATSAEIERLKAKTSTTLTGSEFLTILMVWPLMLSFCALGIVVVWKTTSDPAAVAPHLDIILLALSIFAAPCMAFVAVLGQKIVSDSKAKKGDPE